MTVNRLAGATITLLLSLLLAVPASGAEDLSEAEARGKHIYTKGESTSGRVISAEVKLSAAPASASILPCLQCHGERGEGIGALSPAIDWRVLVDPAAHEHPERRHGIFDERSVARAIRNGVDPAGNGLEPTMPRYRIADEDMADLIAYLKRIGTELDPGISARSIRIGTVLPTAGPLAGIGSAIRQVIEAQFADINAAGGIHGRRLELVVGGYGADDTPAFWAAQDLVAREPVFALLSSFLPGFEPETAELVTDKQLPHVGPFTLLTNDSGRYEFFTQASIVEQTNVLVESTMADGRLPSVAIVYPLVKGFEAMADAARDRVSARGSVRNIPYELNAFDAAGIAAGLAATETEAVVFLGSGPEFVEFARIAEQRSFRPALLAPARFAERVVFELPRSFDGRVYLSYPALPSDHSESGVIDFELLHHRHDIDYSNSLAQVAAFTATRVLVDALQHAGSSPSRAALVSALEAMRNFSPGLTPAVSFGPGQRIGARGAHVLRVDLAEGRLDAEQRWISLAP